MGLALELLLSPLLLPCMLMLCQFQLLMAHFIFVPSIPAPCLHHTAWRMCLLLLPNLMLRPGYPAHCLVQLRVFKISLLPIQTQRHLFALVVIAAVLYWLVI